MPYILIIIGIGLVFYYISTMGKDSDNSGNANYPEAASSKMQFGIGGLACFTIALILFYNTFAASDGGTALVCFAAFIGLTIGGVKLMKAAYEADEKEAKNMAARAEAKSKHLLFEQNQIALENARKAAENQRILEDDRRRTEHARLEKERKAIDFDKQEIEVKEAFIPLAQREGLDVNSWIGSNSQIKQKNIDLQDYAHRKDIDHTYKVKEKNLELDSERGQVHNQLEAADRVDHYRIIGELEAQLEGLYEKRRDIELNETDEVLKNQKLARFDKRIQQLEADIDGRQNRLLSSGDGQETRRLT